MKKNKPKKILPAQKQKPPGLQKKMHPKPEVIKPESICGKLESKVAIISGADSGIGRSIAALFAKEGADCVVVYLKEHKDAQQTKNIVEAHGKRCLLISGDIGKESFCKNVIKKTIQFFGKIDILVNNAAEQHPQKTILEITENQLLKTFRTNIFSYFFLTKAALEFLEKTKGTIINTTSVTAYRGSKELLDYSSTKGAIVAFTRSLALSLVDKKIRVNGVAPGPIWTPLITSTFTRKKVSTFGSDVPMKRPGQPSEVAPCFLFLASDDSSYMTGQIIHPNGGEIINT